jgi:colanic acid biosynthesis glycosyl transferase WcaI
MGWLAKKVKKVRIVLNVQDIHPDLSIESGILRNRLAIRLAQRFEKWVYSVSDTIIVISDGFRKNLLDKGVPAAKILVIPNWVDTDFLKPHPKDNPVSRKLSFADKFVILYSGTISISSNLALEKVLEAAVLLKDEKGIMFAIVGEGMKKKDLQEKKELLGLPNVIFLPFQPYADLPSLFSGADILLVPLDAEKSQLSVPSKLYNFMAVGRPILGLAEEGSEVAGLISRTQCGICVPAEDPSRIADTLKLLRRSEENRKIFGANARKYAEQNFAKKDIMKTYENLLWTSEGAQG